MNRPHMNSAAEMHMRSVASLVRDLESCVVSLQEQGVSEVEWFGEVADQASSGGAAESVPARSAAASSASHRDLRRAERAGSPCGSEAGESSTADDSLDAIAREIAECRLCGLHSTRSRVVPGQGASRPDILFVGEGPGREEDQQGVAFVGAAGKLLTRIIEAMGYEREQVFIANVVKCRPPDNRKPLPDEMESCMPFLRRQIAVLRPRIIVTLGATALEGLIGPPVSITRQRGTWLDFGGIPLMPTFHPSYLLRNESAKRPVWTDMQEVLKALGRDPPDRKNMSR